MTNEDDQPLKRFESFVSEILTVTKEDIRRAEDEARRLARQTEPEEAPEATP